MERECQFVSLAFSVGRADFKLEGKCSISKRDSLLTPPLIALMGVLPHKDAA